MWTISSFVDSSGTIVSHSYRISRIPYPPAYHIPNSTVFLPYRTQIQPYHLPTVSPAYRIRSLPYTCLSHSKSCKYISRSRSIVFSSCIIITFHLKRGDDHVEHEIFLVDKYRRHTGCVPHRYPTRSCIFSYRDHPPGIPRPLTFCSIIWLEIEDAARSNMHAGSALEQTPQHEIAWLNDQFTKFSPLPISLSNNKLHTSLYRVPTNSQIFSLDRVSSSRATRNQACVSLQIIQFYKSIGPHFLWIAKKAF